MKSKIAKAVEKENTSYIACGVGAIMLALAPIVYIFIRYECYKFISKMAFSGWGLIALILIGIVVYAILQYVVFGGKWARWKQIVRGLIKVFLPCAILSLIIHCSIDFLKELQILVGMIAICWSGAYILNPIPEKQFNEGITQQMDIVSYALAKRGKK